VLPRWRTAVRWLAAWGHLAAPTTGTASRRPVLGPSRLCGL